MSDDTILAELTAKARVAEVINALFVATDARDWARVRECFTAAVRFDMTSVAGGSPALLSPEQIASGWETGLAPIESVHHQTGNLSVAIARGEAHASCYGIAYHYRRTASGRNTRVFVGSYDFRLEPHDGDWRIELLRFNLKFIDGNARLESEPA
jgi:hypothetical protein